ncbi:MAG: threonine--tRNA ligase [Bacteroidota bacterium]|jgi:threonyl-tRNA synthetase|nr:threonine--tRNA ligase [Bacteroidota bacterium]
MSDVITITFPNGDQREYPRGTTGMRIAESISPGLAREALGVLVNGTIMDLHRPIDSDVTLKILTWSDDEGREVYWHSSSHLMAHAVETLYPGAKFGVGPAIEEGFYYDIDIPHQLTPEDLVRIEQTMLELAKQDMPFERRVLSRQEALDFWGAKGDQYKLELISEFPDDEVISCYAEGSFTDLCRGPHLPSAGKIKYVKLLTVSGSYWRGDASRPQMQRIYGITFPKKKELDEYLERLEEARKRDHRKLGRELELFAFHDIAPGAPFWLPRGMILFRELQTMIRGMLDTAGYDEILTPILVKKELWEQSGHWQHYKENMFLVEDGEDQIFSLKPMNCPESTYVYRHRVRSYRDLPLRFSEIGTNHRNELSGALNGMFRVRQFHMDDAHLYVRPDQILDEITALLLLVDRFYRVFGFEPFYRLSTRPEDAMGDPALWEIAERGLADALEANGIDYKINPGDGAFYGPKIDISVRDALGRSWQLATIQLDFQMPERFELEYIDENNERKRPVMIHRAIMGSMERFIGVLIEHFAGAFPTWLAPVQAAVLPISDQYLAYARDVTAVLRDAGVRTELDDRSEKIGYKIRDWETHKVPFMLVVGEKERDSRTVSVRRHREGDLGQRALDEFVVMITNEITDKKL